MNHRTYDLAFMKKLHVADTLRARSLLRAVLDYPIVFLRRLDELLALKKTMRHRLLDVHVLPGLARPNRRQRMPVIRRCNANRIDPVIRERFTHVAVQLRLLATSAYDIGATTL